MISRGLGLTATCLILISSNSFASQEIATEITRSYNTVVDNCGSKNSPAFMCSGVLIRGTEVDPEWKYNTWDPSPSSIKSGGISFSYIRKDTKFTKFAYNYNSGYIAYPQKTTPRGLDTLKVLCSFPVDGATFERDKQGCGENSYYPNVSKQCQEIGIFNSVGWVKHYNQKGVNQNRHQCAFNVRYGVENSAAFFSNSLISRRFIGEENAHQQNELRVSAWKPDMAKVLPIQAFFYFDDGLPNAQHAQSNFFQKSGRVVPIVKLTIPKTTKEDFAFTYDIKDQIQITDNPGVTFPDSPGSSTGGPSGVIFPN